MKLNKIAAVTSGILAIAIASPASEPRWVPYEPSVVTLTGTIVEEDYGEDAAPMNRGRRVWILRLDHPVSVRAKPDDEIDTEEKNVKEVHLNVDREKHFVPTEALGKRNFRVTGTLYHAHNWHHLRPIVMLVSDIKPSEAKNNE